jgi:hypothetical protein
MPRPCSQNTSAASAAVSATPHTSGMPNSRLSAMAVPITSARSHAQMATSQAAHWHRLEKREELARQACARSRPVAMPSRTASTCSRIAIRFDSMTTHSRA